MEGRGWLWSDHHIEISMFWVGLLIAGSALTHPRKKSHPKLLYSLLTCHVTRYVQDPTRQHQHQDPSKFNDKPHRPRHHLHSFRAPAPLRQLESYIRRVSILGRAWSGPLRSGDLKNSRSQHSQFRALMPPTQLPGSSQGGTYMYWLLLFRHNCNDTLRELHQSRVHQSGLLHSQLDPKRRSWGTHSWWTCGEGSKNNHIRET